MSEKYFKQPSVMSAQQHFSQVPSVNIPRSTFDRSHAYKTTFDPVAYSLRSPPEVRVALLKD